MEEMLNLKKIAEKQLEEALESLQVTIAQFFINPDFGIKFLLF
jgi:hypothetical protein